MSWRDTPLAEIEWRHDEDASGAYVTVHPSAPQWVVTVTMLDGTRRRLEPSEHPGWFPALMTTAPTAVWDPPQHTEWIAFEYGGVTRTIRLLNPDAKEVLADVGSGKVTAAEAGRRLSGGPFWDVSVALGQGVITVEQYSAILDTYVAEPE